MDWLNMVERWENPPQKPWILAWNILGGSWIPVPICSHHPICRGTRMGKQRKRRMMTLNKFWASFSRVGVRPGCTCRFNQNIVTTCENWLVTASDRSVLYPLVILHSYGKSPFIVSFPIKMVMFHNSLKLPEGSSKVKTLQFTATISSSWWLVQVAKGVRERRVVTTKPARKQKVSSTYSPWLHLHDKSIHIFSSVDSSPDFVGLLQKAFTPRLLWALAAGCPWAALHCLNLLGLPTKKEIEWNKLE